jgi:hypothetical protein
MAGIQNPRKILGREPTLGNQAIEVLVVGPLKTEITAADVVDGLVVNHEGAIRVLQSGVGREDRVVGLYHGCSGLWGGIDAELQLALLSVVDGEAFHEQSSETRARAATEGVEDQEALETNAVVGDASNLVQDLVDQLLANGIVATGVVIGSILLAGNHLLRVEEAAIRAGAHLVDDIGLEIAVDGTRDVLALT